MYSLVCVFKFLELNQHRPYVCIELNNNDFNKRKVLCTGSTHALCMSCISPQSCGVTISRQSREIDVIYCMISR